MSLTKKVALHTRFTDRGAALPGIRAVVWHCPHRRLACSISGRGRGLWASPYFAQHSIRRRSLRGGLAWLVARRLVAIAVAVPLTPRAGIAATTGD